VEWEDLEERPYVYVAPERHFLSDYFERAIMAQLTTPPPQVLGPPTAVRALLA
jgi:hypothetical protein